MGLASPDWVTRSVLVPSRQNRAGAVERFGEVTPWDTQSDVGRQRERSGEQQRDSERARIEHARRGGPGKSEERPRDHHHQTVSESHCFLQCADVTGEAPEPTSAAKTSVRMVGTESHPIGGRSLRRCDCVVANVSAGLSASRGTQCKIEG